MKEQNKTPERELNKMEKSNLSDAEFKTLVIWMLKELSRYFNSIKKIQSEKKDSLIKIKNSVQGNNTRVYEAENQINDMEHKEPKNCQSEKQDKRIQKIKASISSFWDNFKRIQHLHHRGARRRRERTRNWKSI